MGESRNESRDTRANGPQIWTEKLGLVHLFLFSGVILREIGHLATIPIFWSNQCKKSTNYKTRIDPRDLQN